MTKTRLQDLAVMVESAVKTVRLPECDAPVPPDVRTLVMEIIRQEAGRGGLL